tara:strand:- start:509 stop:778 length:270 start_codon:yes stop_codon:yes gene_type:complete
MDKKAVLADIADSKAVDYTDEVDRLRGIDVDEKIMKFADAMESTLNALANLNVKVSKLEADIKATNSDDKYALTKAKLIRIMKDMGYYE